MSTRRSLTVSAAGALVLLTGCSSSNSGYSGATYDIKSGDRTCQVSPSTINTGDVVFKVENTGTDVTEVYVYAKEGATFSQVVGEVENVGPGTTQNLSVSLQPGQYQVMCKPGMTGDGIRTALKVTSAAKD